MLGKVSGRIRQAKSEKGNEENGAQFGLILRTNISMMMMMIIIIIIIIIITWHNGPLSTRA